VPIRYRCDRCGKDLPAGSTDHFVVRIEAFAAETPLEITREDLAQDHGEEIRRLVDELSRAPLDDVEDSNYRAFRFDLCRDCHAAYLRNPLGGKRSD
jgi:hypothetical protein